MLLGKNLRYLRKQKQMTQENLSDQLGIKRTMISAYEDGRSEPKLATLKVIGDILSVSIDELLFHDIEEKGRRASQKRDIKVLTVSLDQEENENITMVPQKASAGYLNG